MHSFQDNLLWFFIFSVDSPLSHNQNKTAYAHQINCEKSLVLVFLCKIANFKSIFF